MTYIRSLCLKAKKNEDSDLKGLRGTSTTRLLRLRCRLGCAELTKAPIVGAFAGGTLEGGILSMYEIGSKVVHPCYGAGTIARIEEKSIDGSAEEYYVIDTIANSMQLMVPVHRAESVGIRPVNASAKLRRVLRALRVSPPQEEIEKDYRVRHSKMGEQLKSGSLEKVSLAVRALYFLGMRRPLGVVDRRHFKRGKDLLASELALASGSDIEAAERRIEENLDQMRLDVE